MLSIFILSSQLINYYNYMNGRKPTDLKVFHMISGFISPKSIGINDRKLVIKLCKICNKSLKAIKPVIVVAKILGIILITYLQLKSNIDNLFLLISILFLPTILALIATSYAINILFYQLFYYF